MTNERASALIEWHLKEAERERWNAETWVAGGHRDRATAPEAKATFHTTAAETVKGLVEERERLGVIAEVAAERRRQVEGEGWTAEHDDAHDRGDLAAAAACYALGRPLVEHAGYQDVTFGRPLWPWDHAWWKPAGLRRNLIKAAALIVAEIERLDRAEASK